MNGKRVSLKVIYLFVIYLTMLSVDHRLRPLVGSNPTWGIDVCVCVYSVFVFCV
jgi:hypothetical protein